MGWAISIPFLVAYFITKDVQILIASGLFAIAGSIASVAVNIKK